jgi:hypothetical protein
MYTAEGQTIKTHQGIAQHQLEEIPAIACPQKTKSKMTTSAVKARSPLDL